MSKPHTWQQDDQYGFDIQCADCGLRTTAVSIVTGAVDPTCRTTSGSNPCIVFLNGGVQKASIGDSGVYIVNAKDLEQGLKKAGAVKKLVCECGSEKVGSPRHSTWCPLYG